MGTEQADDKEGISLSREIRGQIFLWVGIVGGALSIVNHWSNFITLADWMRWIVEHFSAITHEFWRAAASIIGIEVPLQVARALTVTTFYLSLVGGTIIVYGLRRPMLRGHFLSGLDEGLGNGVGRYIIRFTRVALATAAILAASVSVAFWLSPMPVPTAFVYFIRLFFPIIVYAVLFWGQRMEWLLVLLLAFLFINWPMIIDTGIVLHSANNIAFAMLAMLFYLLIFTIPALAAPTQPLTRRLAFLLLFVAIIFGLSEVSKLAERLHTAASTIEAQH